MRSSPRASLLRPRLGRLWHRPNKHYEINCHLRRRKWSLALALGQCLTLTVDETNPRRQVSGKPTPATQSVGNTPVSHTKPVWICPKRSAVRLPVLLMRNSWQTWQTCLAVIVMHTWFSLRAWQERVGWFCSKFRHFSLRSVNTT